MRSFLVVHQQETGIKGLHGSVTQGMQVNIYKSHGCIISPTVLTEGLFSSGITKPTPFSCRTSPNTRFNGHDKTTAQSAFNFCHVSLSPGFPGHALFFFQASELCPVGYFDFPKVQVFGLR